MKSRIKLVIHPLEIFFIPIIIIQLVSFNERKEIYLTWLIFSIQMRLYKRNLKEWKN